MIWSQIPRDPSARILRQFSGGWIVVFGALAATQQWRHHHADKALILTIVAVVGFAGLLRPALMRWTFVGASILAFPIGWVVTNLVLGVLFYLVLTPIAFVFRIEGRDALQLRRPKTSDTLWRTRDEAADPGRYLRQF